MIGASQLNNEHLNKLTIKGFKKVNEFSDPELIEPSELTKLENMVLDIQAFKAVKRGGYALFNSNSAGASVDQLFDCIKSDGYDYLIALINKRLYKSLAGTGVWTLITAPVTSSVDTRLSMAPYNGNYIFASLDGVPTLLQSDLTTYGNLTVNAPTVSSVTTSEYSGDGNYTGKLTPNSIYRYVLVYETLLGEKSAPSTEILNLVATSWGGSVSNILGDSIKFASLPISSDSRVISKLLYRTKANGDTFYLCARLNKDAVNYIDSAPDTSLNTSSEGELQSINLMNKAKFTLVHAERIFLANINETLAPPLMPVLGNTGGTYENFGGEAQNVTSGTLPAGTYSYKMVFRDSSGNVSSVKTIKASVVVGSPNNAIRLFNVLVPSNSSVGREVYRAVDTGSGLGPYYLINLPTTEWTIVDDGYAASSTITVPSATSGTADHKCVVRWSEVGQPATLLDINFLQVFPDDGDEITGMVDDLDGILIFKRNSICKLFVTGSSGWKLEKIIDNLGCDEPMSIQKIGDKIYFMNNKQVFKLGDPISVSKDRINTFNSITTVHASVYLSAYQWYVLLVTISSVHTILAYDEKIQCWYKFTSDNISPCSILEKKLGSTKGTFLLGSSAYYVNKYDLTNKRDVVDGVNPSASILVDLQTKTFTFNDPTVFARPRLLQYDCKKTNPILSESATTSHIITRIEDGVSFTFSDTTNAAGMIITSIVHTKGTGYSKGDILTVPVGTGGTVIVDSVDAGGTIGSVTLLTRGSGYTTGTGISVSGGGGSGAKVSITASQTGYKNERAVITGIDSARKLSYEVTGRTLEEFNAAEIKYRTISKGSRI